MKPVAFFTDDIEIRPHSATDAVHLSRSVRLGDFAQGEPMSLYETEDGELFARTPGMNGRFIEGPEVVPCSPS